MGVYISGLEIPPKGKGVVVILCSSGAVYLGGQKVGTAVPVPPHGRLIDADALAEEDNRQYNEYRKDNGLDDTCHRVIQWMLSDAPTVIEAEEAVQDAGDGP